MFPSSRVPSVAAMTSADMAAFAGRLGLDVLCLLVLIGVLYRRRAAGPEMALVFTALNIGLFAAVSVIGTGDFPTGVGFGLFGLLSLVRLRSAAFTLKDVAYTFAALVLALVNALPGRELVAVVALDVLVLAALWVTDESRKATPTRVMRLTLDRAVTDPEDVRVDLETPVVRTRRGLRGRRRRLRAGDHPRLGPLRARRRLVAVARRPAGRRARGRPGGHPWTLTCSPSTSVRPASPRSA